MKIISGNPPNKVFQDIPVGTVFVYKGKTYFKTENFHNNTVNAVCFDTRECMSFNTLCEVEPKPLSELVVK